MPMPATAPIGELWTINGVKCLVVEGCRATAALLQPTAAFPHRYALRHPDGNMAEPCAIESTPMRVNFFGVCLAASPLIPENDNYQEITSYINAAGCEGPWRQELDETADADGKMISHGDQVHVTHEEGDVFDHDFAGTVEELLDDDGEVIVRVEDQDEQVWDVEPRQVRLVSKA